MTQPMEFRYFPLEECRAEDGAGADRRAVTGTAVRYGDVATFPWGRERIAAGAFAPIGDVILNRQHARADPLARTGGGGLVLDDTAERLAIRAELPATRAADDVLLLIRMKVMRGLSVGFNVTAESIVGGVRVIERAQLATVAIVDTPAYPDSEVEARCQAAAAVRQAPVPALDWWRL